MNQSKQADSRDSWANRNRLEDAAMARTMKIWLVVAVVFLVACAEAYYLVITQ